MHITIYEHSYRSGLKVLRACVEGVETLGFNAEVDMGPNAHAHVLQALGQLLDKAVRANDGIARCR